jgi:hypothetical protein
MSDNCLTYGQDNFNLLDGLKRHLRMMLDAHACDRRMFVYREDILMIEATVKAIEGMKDE